MINGVVTRTEESSPQDGNLSPLLSNIYLTAFNRELERRGVELAVAEKDPFQPVKCVQPEF